MALPSPLSLLPSSAPLAFSKELEKQVSPFLWKREDDTQELCKRIETSQISRCAGVHTLLRKGTLFKTTGDPTQTHYPRLQLWIGKKQPPISQWTLQGADGCRLDSQEQYKEHPLPQILWHMQKIWESVATTNCSWLTSQGKKLHSPEQQLCFP